LLRSRRIIDVDSQPPSRPGPATPTDPRAAPPQPARTRNWVLAAAILVVVLVMGVIYVLTNNGATAAEQGSDSAPATLDVGDTVELRTGYGDVLEITITAAESKKSCGATARRPETGSYLIADVTVEVTSGRATVKAADFDFAATAGGWPHRDIGPDFTGCGGSGLGTLNNIGAGTRRDGRLVFDVAGPGRIVYHVSSGTTPFGAQWNINAQ
jgi:hypothetical protein